MVEGIVCLPSFHAIWAVLSAVTLWSVKPLRIPSSILAVLIIASTVTSGGHYACDTVAGILLAGAAVLCANAIMRGIDA